MTPRDETEPKTCLLPSSAGIKGMHHHHPGSVSSSVAVLLSHLQASFMKIQITAGVGN